VQNGSIAYGDKVIFDDLSFSVLDGDKISLVGKNGAGKSTLMKIITGDKDLDSGERFLLQGVKVGYLQQEVKPKAGQTIEQYVFEQLQQSGEAELHAYKVDKVITPLGLDPAEKMTSLSGGQLRRASLARALVEEPDILLLDEPTNHLDLDAIQWLEDFLRRYRGAVLCISHDKAFLANISNKIFWLDRGRMRACPRGFSYFDEWSTQLMEQEARELRNRQKALELEVEWASRGVPARRKRNVRRLELMREERTRLKRDMSAWRQATRRIEVGEMEESELASRAVAEFFKVSKSYTRENGRELPILKTFSLRVAKGDRIGILGRNGSGKTTFLRLLIGEEKADQGKVKLARELTVSYFDQTRRDLDEEETVQRVLCPQGGEYIDVMGKARHVAGYLRDFMFDPALRDQRVKTLSGGQKNRLLLARVLANPQPLMILDEPTNDLDMDTLDMLEEILAEYKGTLIVVSHDRDFLDQTVSKILAFEGDGRIDGCVGGYSDYVAYKKRRAAHDPDAEDDAIVWSDEPRQRPPRPAAKPAAAPAPAAAQPKRLTYKLQYELDHLPGKIEKFQQEIAGYNSQLADPDFYHNDKDGFATASRRLARAHYQLAEAENRWLELEDMREKLARGEG
jgi:ATP-binding cassette subfamily F protein uup